VSEYQYYEFRAIDRPLTSREIATLRQHSTRAVITASGFKVDYSWGDFKGDASAWMETHFDAFLYFANWGSHELSLRLPKNLLPLAAVKPYLVPDRVEARSKGSHVVLDLLSEEEGADWVDEEPSLSALIATRTELASGDLRPLYLAWLRCAQEGELADDDVEPPCPPGLARLTAAQQALVDFLRVDEDLVAAAAAGAPEPIENDHDARRRWVAGLPARRKDAILLELLEGNPGHVQAALRRELRSPASPPRAALRTVGALIEGAEVIARQRRQQEEARAARARVRREREEEQLRQRRLESLARREPRAWTEVDDLIASKHQGCYDEAVALLVDLRSLAASRDRLAEADRRMAQLRVTHAKKTTFIARLDKVGINPPGPLLG
jgi:hypothetical protein